MTTCTCPRIDGFRIRSRSCAHHRECLASIGPVPKLDGATFVCTRPAGHRGDHAAPDGTWWTGTECSQIATASRTDCGDETDTTSQEASK